MYIITTDDCRFSTWATLYAVQGQNELGRTRCLQPSKVGCEGQPGLLGAEFKTAEDANSLVRHSSGLTAQTPGCLCEACIPPRAPQTQHLHDILLVV